MINNNKDQQKSQDQNILTNEESAYESLEGGWVKTPKLILSLPTLSSTAKLVYAEFIDIYRSAKKQNPDNPAIFPKQKTLARRTNEATAGNINLFDINAIINFIQEEESNQYARKEQNSSDGADNF